jgi:polyisoprenoid-binding protein YceI
MLKSFKGAAALALTAALCASGVAQAQPAPAAAPPAPRPAPPLGKPDASLAPAGKYNLDSRHAGVIARVSHIGYSMSVFRFGDVKGSLTWDPAKPAASTLSVTVAPGSIETNVPKFAEELAGKDYLNAAAFPTATFVSTAFAQTDATHGKVTGDFTLMGKTKPVTFDVTLIGAGPGFGAPRMGVMAVTEINPQDYGLPAMFNTPIELKVDVEFVKAAS